MIFLKEVSKEVYAYHIEYVEIIELLRCRNTVFHHEAGFLSDPRSFYHNRQEDGIYCFDNES